MLEADCFNLTSGTDSLSFDIFHSALTGPSGFLLYWGPGLNPDTDPVTLQADSNTAPVTITRDGLSMTASLPLLDADLQPTGDTATIEGLTFVNDGDPTGFNNFRDGNRTVKMDGTIQPLIATGGTLHMPGGLDFDLTGCGGETIDYTSFETNPLTYVETSRYGITLACGVSTDAGEFDLFALADRQHDLFEFQTNFIPAGGSDQFGGDTTGLTLSDKGVHGTQSMVDPDTNEPLGTAIFDGTMYDRQRLELSQNTDTGRTMLIGNSFKIRGTVTFEPSGTSFDLSSCQVLDRRSQDITHG